MEGETRQPRLTRATFPIQLWPQPTRSVQGPFNPLHPPPPITGRPIQILYQRPVDHHPRGMHSDIHVLVRFHEQSVFAGEELRCTVSFRNVANLSEPPIRPRQSSRRESIGHIAAQVAKSNAANRSSHAARPSHNNDNLPDLAQRHRPSGSSPPPHPGFEDHQAQTPGNKQQRSVSIISVTSPIAGEVGDSTSSSWAKQQRLSHQRSSTTGNQYGMPRVH